MVQGAEENRKSIEEPSTCHALEDIAQGLGHLDVLGLLRLVLLDEVTLLRHPPPVLRLDPHEPAK